MPEQLTHDVALQRILDEADGPPLGRAKDYVAKRRVGRVLREGDELVADVQGSADDPYRVRIRLAGPQAPEADCNCPFEGEWCKHALAVVLVAKRSPDEVTERPPLKTVLETITKTTLVDVVDRLARGIPAFDDALRMALTPVDAVSPIRDNDFEEHVRKLVHGLDHLRRSEAYGQVGRVVDRVLEVVENIKTLDFQGKEAEAIAALEGATRAYVGEWGVLDGSDGRTPEPLVAMGDLWTRIMLRRHAAKKSIPAKILKQLDAWNRAVQGYDVYEFGAALEAARHGFDSPLLVEDPEDDGAELDRDAYRLAMVRDRLGLAAQDVGIETLFMDDEPRRTRRKRSRG